MSIAGPVLVSVLLVACALAAPAADLVQSPLPGYGNLRSNNYAGYINVGPRKAFYWFVESENAPSTDPLVLWLNGGPGCSSLLGMLTENGPYQNRYPGTFFPNQYSWTGLANMLYLESPPGVGFSIDTTPPIVWNDTNTAAFNYQALIGFFAKFPEYRANKFYLSGESYAGHYIPQLAYNILQGSDPMKTMVQGFMVGNPCTGDVECTDPNDPGLELFLRYHGFNPLNTSIPSLLNQANYDPYDILVPVCDNTETMRQVRWPHPVMEALRRRTGQTLAKAGAPLPPTGPPAPYGPCASNWITEWLNRPDIKAALHAAPNVQWVDCSNSLNYTFNNYGVVNLYQQFFASTNWKIMIYSGTADTVVNFVSTQTVVNQMRRPLQNRFFSPWYHPYIYNASQTQLGGFYLQFDKISWAGVRDAGHMVPQYNPPAAYELFLSYLTLGRPGRLSS